MEKDRKLLEKLQEKDLLNFYIVSLMSADSLMCVEDCEKALEIVDFCIEILPENNIDNKERIKEHLMSAREIVLRDLEMFKNQK